MNGNEYATVYKHLQFTNHPLHDPKIVHHLNKCNKENDGGELEEYFVNHITGKAY